MNVHCFDSTKEAYDATQFDDRIRNGDILMIASEKVIGVAYTWPFAVSKENGKLHELFNNTFTSDSVPLMKGYEKAKEISNHLGW